MSAKNRFRFSVEKLNAIKRPEKTVVYYDSEEQKLGIRVQPSGRKTYFVLKQVAGKPRRKTLGQFPELPIEAARRHAKSLLVELAEWRNNDCAGPSPTAKAAEGFTLDEGFKLYVKQQVRARADSKGRNANAAEDRRRKLFERYCAPLKSKSITSITTTQIENWCAKISEKSGVIAANRALSLLRTLYRFLISKNLCVENPTRTTTLFSERDRRRSRYLQPDELDRFWNALAVEKNRDFADFVALLLATGVRKANLYAARKMDVSTTLEKWTIARTKSGPHTVKLTAKALSIFKKRLEKHKDSPWVFPSATSASGHVEDYKNQWYRLLRNAGFKPKTHDVTMHDLRRTAASYMAIAGVSLPIIGKFLGHSDLSSTEIYARLTDTAVGDAAELGEKTMRLQADKATKQMETQKVTKLLAE
jgi:site-specific recombinase XerD